MRPVLAGYHAKWANEREIDKNSSNIFLTFKWQWYASDLSSLYTQLFVLLPKIGAETQCIPFTAELFPLLPIFHYIVSPHPAGRAASCTSGRLRRLTPCQSPIRGRTGVHSARRCCVLGCPDNGGPLSTFLRRSQPSARPGGGVLHIMLVS